MSLKSFGSGLPNVWLDFCYRVIKVLLDEMILDRYLQDGHGLLHKATKCY